MTAHPRVPRRPLFVALLIAACGVSSTSRAADGPPLYSGDRSAASTIHDRDPGYRPTYPSSTT